MIAKTTIKGVIGRDYTMMDLVSFFKKNAAAEGYEITVDSVGGLVDEGFEMYELIKKQAKSKPIKTIAKEVMSIATIIYLAANDRVASKKSVFMIHTPMAVFSNVSGELVFTKYDFDEFSAELAAEEKKIVSCYKAVTGIDEETLTKLLKKDKYFTGIEAYDLGFATELKNVETYAILKNQSDMNLTSIFNKLVGITNVEGELPAEAPVTPEVQPTPDASLEERVKILEDMLVKCMETIVTLQDRVTVLETEDALEVESPLMDAKLEAVKVEAVAQAKEFYNVELNKLAAAVDNYSKVTKTSGVKDLPSVTALQSSVSDISKEKSFFDYGNLKTK